MAITKAPARPSQLSEEKVYDSSDDDNNAGSSTESSPKPKSKRPTLKKTNGVVSSGKFSKQKATTADSSSNSEEPSEIEEGTESASREASIEIEPGQEDDDGNSSQSESDVESSSGSSKRKSPEEADQQSPLKKSMTTPASPVNIAPRKFKAPQGYEPFILSASDYASESASLFEDLSEKQIWHISAPDTISIETIKELDVQAALQGNPIFSRDGVNYNMHPSPSSNDVLLLPQGTNSIYKQSNTKISKSFHLRQMSSKPKEKSKDQADRPLIFTATEEGEQKIPRKQPEGLKMRYTPFGAPPTTGDNDVEMTTDTAMFQMPDDIVGERSPEKRKKKKNKAANREVDAMQIDEDSPEKTKSRKDTTTGSGEKKKKKKRRIVDEDVS